MAMRSFVSRTPVRRLMEFTRISGLRYFGDGRVFGEEELGEEERAAENVYIKKMERERMEKLKQKAEKEKAEKENAEKKMERERMEKLKQKAEKEKAEKENAEKGALFQSTLLEDFDRERCRLLSQVTNGVVRLTIQARHNGILVGGTYEATGFIISNCGHFVSNVHVVSEKCLTTFGAMKYLLAEVTVSHIGKQEVCLPVKVIILHSGVDLAICQFVIPRGVSVHVFDFCYSEPEVGQQVITLGNPSGCPNTSRYGAVADVGFSLEHFSAQSLDEINIRRQFAPSDFDYILFDMNAACGFSGGPSFNVKGRVLAVNQATSKGDFGFYNLAVPIKHLWRLILLHVKTGKTGYINDDGIVDEDEDQCC